MMEGSICRIERYLNDIDFDQWDWHTVLENFEPTFQKNGFREECIAPRQHILLIRLDAMGDMVISTGFVREVRQNNPVAYITLVVSPMIYPLVCKCPYVNCVLVVDAKLFYINKRKFFTDLLHLCLEKLWKERYSLSICPQWGDDKTVSQLVAYLSGAARRVGYSCNVGSVYGFGLLADDLEKGLMTDSYIIPADIVHEVERSFYILELLGWHVNDKSLEVWYSQREKLTARLLLSNAVKSKRTLFAIGLGAGTENRKYPVDQYAEVFNRLGKRINAYFIILGGKNEQQDAVHLQSLLPQGITCNLAGKTSILETAAVLSMTNLYVGNDTGVMHMAAALGLPVVMISREKYDYDERLAGVLSANERFAPWRTNYVICYPEKRLGSCVNWVGYGGCSKNYSHCICQIKPEEIVKAVELLLQQ